MGICLRPVPEGLVLAPTAKSLRAVHLKTGKVAWTFAPHDGTGEYMYSSPTHFDDKICIGDRGGYLYALDSMTGNIVWRAYPSRADNNQINSAPIIHSGVVAVGTNAKFVAGFDMQTGRELWRQPIAGPCTSTTPAGDGEMLAWSRSTAYRFRVHDGEPLGRWHRRHFAIWSAAAAGDVTLLVRHREWAGEPYLWPVAELVAYCGAVELYRSQYAISSAAFLRYEQSTGLIYEMTYRGIGILDPNTGTRRAVIADSKDCSWMLSPVTATPETLMAAINNHAFGGERPARVVMLRHP